MSHRSAAIRAILPQLHKALAAPNARQAVQ
jgi:hypothetical protein